MSVLSCCLAYMQLLEHTKCVVQRSVFQGKKIETDFPQMVTKCCLKLVYFLTCVQSIVQAFLYF
jgi:hypothetical protein